MSQLVVEKEILNILTRQNISKCLINASNKAVYGEHTLGSDLSRVSKGGWDNKYHSCMPQSSQRFINKAEAPFMGTQMCRGVDQQLCFQNLNDKL